MADPNMDLLTEVAEALGDLREHLVLVGGCATALLITDPAAVPVRVTKDVDAIVAVVSTSAYHSLGESLRAKGFSQPLEAGDPPYRWTIAGLKLDVMPIDPDVLGFSNRWYELALQTATYRALREGLSIRLVTPTCFIATKLVAFFDRGKGDYLESHDLEDVISVVDGRPELVVELGYAERELREYVAGIIAGLVENEGFLNALPGLVIDGSPATRSPVVLQRLRAIAQMRGSE